MSVPISAQPPSDDSLDYRSLAQRLDLLHFQDEAPGMVFWHPRGFALCRLLEDAARDQARGQGYAEVRTPQVMRRPIWEMSGHWDNFASGMFKLDLEAREAALKPVSCPGHAQLVARRPPSYRELPLRLSELGLVHRDEPSGTLHGLLRLRQFTQDDGHVFCAEADAQAEVLRFCRELPAFYRAFGFSEVSLALSLRPDQRAGDEGLWDWAEATLQAALQQLGEPFAVQPGAGAFYGPKIEYSLRDRRGRSWQCGTIQLDLVMPRRFDLRYLDADGGRKHPVMLHRAVYGSLERFLGLLLERHGGLLPAWLAPVQVGLLPISAGEGGAGQILAQQLRAAGLRVEIDADDSLARRIARAHQQGIPVQAIVGAREAAAGEVTLRGPFEQRRLPIAQAVEELAHFCARPALFSGAHPC